MPRAGALGRKALDLPQLSCYQHNVDRAHRTFSLFGARRAPRPSPGPSRCSHRKPNMRCAPCSTLPRRRRAKPSSSPTSRPSTTSPRSSSSRSCSISRITAWCKAGAGAAVATPCLKSGVRDLLRAGAADHRRAARPAALSQPRGLSKMQRLRRRKRLRAATGVRAQPSGDRDGAGQDHARRRPSAGSRTSRRWEMPSGRLTRASVAAGAAATSTDPLTRASLPSRP